MKGDRGSEKRKMGDERAEQDRGAEGGEEVLSWAGSLVRPRPHTAPLPNAVPVDENATVPAGSRGTAVHLT